MADNTLYNNLMRAGYAATGGAGAAFENLPDGSVKIHPATDTAWYGVNRLADSVTSKTPVAAPNTKQQKINAQHEVEDKQYAASQGWDKTTPGSVTQGPKKKNFLERAIDSIAGKFAAKAESNDIKKNDPNNLANVNYGDGNIDLNSRPAIQNPDGPYSTVDSITIEEDGTYVNIPTVVWLDGEWQHVDENTAKEYYRQTGQYLGKYSTLDEAIAKAKQLSRDQATLYGLDQQNQPMTMPSFDPEAAQKRQKDQQYWLWQALHPNMTIEDYYRIFPNRAPK